MKKTLKLIVVALLIIIASACDNSKSMSMAGTEWTRMVIYNDLTSYSILKFEDDTLCKYSYVSFAPLKDKVTLEIEFRYKKNEKLILLSPLNLGSESDDWEAELYKKDGIRLNNYGNTLFNFGEDFKTMGRNKANEKNKNK